VALLSRRFEPAIVRSRPVDSWRWIRWDVPARLCPLLLVPLVYLYRGYPPGALGLNASHLTRDLALGLLLGLPAFAVGAAFNEWLQRRGHARVVPTTADLWLQTGYYVVLNAPIEELFFRGQLQNGLALWWQAPLPAFLVATTIFTGYHLLGRWSLEATAGAGVAGVALGLLFMAQNPPSLVLPVTVHAFITCGFLGLGPWLWWRLRLPRFRAGSR
jgi:membrane protease YdiL (CAAX protease family)